MRVGVSSGLLPEVKRGDTVYLNDSLIVGEPEEDAMVQTLQELVWIINEAKSELAHRQSSSWMQYWTAKEVYHSHKRRGQSCKTVTDQILSRALGLMASMVDVVQIMVPSQGPKVVSETTEKLRGMTTTLFISPGHRFRRHLRTLYPDGSHR